jgi:hypothetical protein
MDHETHVNGAPDSRPALNPPYVAPRNEVFAPAEPLGKGRLARRTFLRGVGTALALPCLDAMLPKVARAAGAVGKPPVRMAFLFSPNGVIPDSWTPKDVGRNYTLSPSLEPLASVRDEVLVLSGFSQKKGFDMGDGAGDHARSAATYLTGVHPFKTAGSNIRAGVSVDQIAAARIGRRTPLPSLEVGIDAGAIAGNCDSGYSCAYSSCISWKTPTTPMAKEINPKLVFERMFGNAKVDPRERARRDYLRKSILDLVRDDSARLQRQLGTADRMKIDEYFTGIRELEVRIEQSARTANRRPPEMQMPAGVPEDFERHVRLMADLLVLAFQTDTTRIATFMFANEGSNRLYSMVGAKDGHHSLSHHQNKEELVAQIRLIDRYLVSQYAYVVQKMKSIREGNGTLLDNCMIMYGSGLGDGNSHTHDHLPIVMAGRGGGTIQPGRHMMVKQGTPLNNLFLSLLERVGAPTDSFGDSTNRLYGLDG